VTQQLRFLLALKRIQSWYADSVKARDYNSPASSSSKPGAVVLRVQRYPSTADWFVRYSRARSEDAREEVIQGLEAEFSRLTSRPLVEAFRDHWGKTRYRKVVTA
jgi:hypothetical protein